MGAILALCYEFNSLFSSILFYSLSPIHFPFFFYFSLFFLFFHHLRNNSRLFYHSNVQTCLIRQGFTLQQGNVQLELLCATQSSQSSKKLTKTYYKIQSVSDGTAQTGGVGGSGRDLGGMGERCAMAISNKINVR